MNDKRTYGKVGTPNTGSKNAWIFRLIINIRNCYNWAYRAKFQHCFFFLNAGEITATASLMMITYM
jgi:hypothetical protein